MGSAGEVWTTETSSSLEEISSDGAGLLLFPVAGDLLAALSLNALVFHFRFMASLILLRCSSDLGLLLPSAADRDDDVAAPEAILSPFFLPLPRPRPSDFLFFFRSFLASLPSQKKKRNKTESASKHNHLSLSAAAHLSAFLDS